MSSILTNNSAMVALQTLKSINNDLAKTQSIISTGKDIASAKDNSAVWAISKTMESDVKGFKAISDSLALGESTIAVARNASETVTDLLTDVKEKIVGAQESNVDRAKLQTDIEALVGQIKSVVGAAQFNGLNLVQGSEDVNILASLDRSSDGSVVASDIAVNRFDLSTTKGQLGTGGGLTDLSANITESSLTLSNAAIRDDGATVPANADITIGGNFSTSALSLNINGTTVSFGVGELSATAATASAQIASAINAAQIEGVAVTDNAGTLEFESTTAFSSVDVTASVTGGAGTLDGGTADVTVTMAERAESFTFASATVNEGDGYQLAFGSQTFSYVASTGETMEDVVKGLKVQIDNGGIEGITTNVSQNASNEWVLKIDNDSATSQTVVITANDDANDNAVVSGGLQGLDEIDVTTDAGADGALENIEALIDSAIDAAASFGSAQGRIETQSEFISKLTDSLKSGIGSMVDADMEEASARLQALQVQQQLGIQSLSIANQAPQSVLSLFR